MPRWLLLTTLLTGCARNLGGLDPVTLWFGGDVHLGERGAHALDALALDAPLVVNLEGPISRAFERSTAARLVNPPHTAARLHAAGVVAAGVDNNHALDDGPGGVKWTREALTKHGVLPLDQARLGNGVTLLQVDLSQGVPPDLGARLDALARPSVVLFHVSAPPLYLPEKPLEEAVERAIAAEVSAVLAHGSHVVGKVERRAKTVVAWGLGNLAFDCECTSEREGLLVRLSFDDTTHAVRAAAHPVRAGLNGEAAQRLDDARTELDLLESLGSKLSARTVRSAEW